TSSSSETRLFRFFSPENTTVPSPRAHSQTQIDKKAETIRMLFIFVTWPIDPISSLQSSRGHHIARKLAIEDGESRRSPVHSAGAGKGQKEGKARLRFVLALRQVQITAGILFDEWLPDQGVPSAAMSMRQ